MSAPDPDRPAAGAETPAGASGLNRLRALIRPIVQEYLREAGDDARWGLSLELSIVAGSLVTFLCLTTKLGPVGYGYYAGIMALTGAVATFGGAWVSMVLIEKTIRRREPLEEVTRSSLSWTSLATMGALAAAALLGPVLLPHVSLAAIVLFVGAEVAGNQFVQLVASILVVEHGFALSARLKIVYVVVTTAILGAQWATNHVSLVAVGVGQFVSATIVGGAALVWAHARYGVSARPGVPRLADARTGLLYVAVLGGFNLQEDADKMLLVRYHKTSAAGQYAAAYNIVQVVLLPLRAAVSATHWRFLVHDE
ncbi:MAG: hypothetical protein ACHQNA_10980, partial [Acidimicrobiales bacterium]